MKNFLRKLMVVLGLISLVLLLLVGLTGMISSVKSQAILPQAEHVAEEFFTQFNASQFEAIYDNLADGRLRLVQSKKDFLALLQAVQKKIGKVVKKNREATKLQSLADGVYFEIAYTTVHESGSAVETLTLRKNNEKWLLVGYTVASRELILR
ncbi:MAG: DUF4019 domain-containing protein [Candidatus Omnitrophica bacterium]|nr:DUF4019 domain-containing protein [Candidatus Omnitrophota bacterium]